MVADEDMTPTGIHFSMKVKNKLSLFLSLHNDINKNLLLHNIVGTFNMFRNKVYDDVNMEKTLSMTSTIDRAWIYHAYD
jgi:hypothetical protein